EVRGQMPPDSGRHRDDLLANLLGQHRQLLNRHPLQIGRAVNSLQYGHLFKTLQKSSHFHTAMPESQGTRSLDRGQNTEIPAWARTEFNPRLRSPISAFEM